MAKIWATSLGSAILMLFILGCFVVEKTKVEKNT